MMWVSKRLDFAWNDLVFALAGCCIPMRRRTWAHRVEQLWSDNGQAIACLSVRSGFDLLLTSAQFPRQGEIVFSALTIGDMPAIAEHHGLIPVPIDIERESTAPRVHDLVRAITPKTKAIVVTHLYGGRIDIDPIVAVARERDLLLIEDCAQAFAGVGYSGHPASDVTMFSFGPIKTATALGGGLLRVKDEALLERMRDLQAEYAVQSTTSYILRLLKYGLLRALSGRWVYGGICRVAQAIGVDHDRVVHGLTRSFRGRGFIRAYRKQPCAGMLRLLHRRLGQDQSQLQRRAIDGARLRQRLGPAIVCPGAMLSPHYFWVFPILTRAPERLISALRDTGFDATAGRSLDVVERATGRSDGDNSNARAVLSHMVFLPFYPEMTDEAWANMAGVVNEVAGRSDSNSAPATSAE